MSDDMTQRDAIFGGSPDLQEIVELDLTDVQPDPNQPRQFFDEEDLEELASSIRAHGQLVPILVRPAPGGDRTYIIIGGERRYRAFERLGLGRIQAIIKRVDDKQARELALVDNLQRVDLSPFEEAAGYARLMDEFGYTQEKVAEQVGKNRTTVTRILSLNNLPEQIKDEARRVKVTKSALIELASIDDEKRRNALWEKVKKGATVQDARKEKQAKSGEIKPLTAKAQERRFRNAVKSGRELLSELDRILSDDFLLERSDDQKDLAAIHQDLMALTAKIGQHLKSVERKKTRRGKATTDEAQTSAEA
jgi:ParB family transcriptional regulator, chromosome partitioning protein